MTDQTPANMVMKYLRDLALGQSTILEKLENDGWISMKERQPEDFQSVLCVNSNGWMTVANRFHDTRLGSWNGSHVSAEDGPHDDTLVIGDILYWRELPQRPKLPLEATVSTQREPQK
jgi:hypothetical protein